MKPKRIAVVGGGIAGLTATFGLSEAQRAGALIEAYLFEASPRLGGALRTERIDACVVEAGADSFLTEKRDAIEVCHQVGLSDQLIGSEDAQRKTLILHQGRLVPLPEGFDFLVPTRFLAAARTPLLSLRDKLALAAEVWVRPPTHTGDESVASLVERHFSPGLRENIVDPLLMAVYGGDSHLLSAQAVLPRLVEMEQRWGSLIRGFRQAARERKRQRAQQPHQATVRGSLFTTLREGLESLVGALGARLGNVRVVCGRRVVEIIATPASGGGYQLRFEGNESFDANAVILALPAYQSARLLAARDPMLADRLAEIPYSSSLIVAVAYDARVQETLPRAFGFLVPREEKLRIRACTFVGQKFRHRVASNRALLRCFLGGVRDEAVLQLSDAEVAATVQRELRRVLRITGDPVFLKVYRWPQALAQYTVGHPERLSVIRSRLAEHRGLFLCGNAYQGVGIPDCIRSGKAAAADCLRQLTQG